MTRRKPTGRKNQLTPKLTNNGVEKIQMPRQQDKTGGEKFAFLPFKKIGD